MRTNILYWSLLLSLQLILSLASQPLKAQLPVSRSWDSTIGGNRDDYFTCMVLTSDGGYLLGGYTNSGISGDKSTSNRGGADYWVVKINANGSKMWEKTFGGDGNDELRALVETVDGGFLLAGTSDSNTGGDKTEVAKGASDFWVVKINDEGIKEWDKTYGGNGADILTSLVTAQNGGYLLGGYSRSDAGGDKTDANKSVIDNLPDYWVVKINGDGSRAWDKTLGGDFDDLLTCLVTSADGGYLLGGMSWSSSGQDKSEDCRGGLDLWVVKLNRNGVKEWDRVYGGLGPDILEAMTTTQDGGYLLGGRYGSDNSGPDKTEASRGGSDYWILKLDSDGSKVWDKTIGGNKEEYLSAIVSTPDGGYLLGGSSRSVISGERTVASRGGMDYWIVKLNSDGTKIWDQAYGGSSGEILSSLEATLDGGYILGGFSDSPATSDKTQESKGGIDYWIVKLSSTLLNTVPEEGALGLFVYPNPSSDNLTVHLQNDNITGEPATIGLYNTVGKLMLHQNVNGTELKKGINISVSDVPRGTYFLQIHSKQKRFTKKVIFY